MTKRRRIKNGRNFDKKVEKINGKNENLLKKKKTSNEITEIKKNLKILIEVKQNTSIITLSNQMENFMDYL